MHVTLNVKHAPRHASAEELLERERLRIDRHLGGVSRELVSLHCELDQNPHQREAYASLSLSLPDGTLNARSTGPNLLAALRKSADAVIGELDRKRGRARRAARGGGSLGAEAVSVLNGKSPDPIQERSLVIQRGVAELYRFIRMERDRHVHSLDSQQIGDIEIPDVVDDAVVRALQSEAECPEDVPFDRWLVSCAYDALVAREEEVLRSRPDVSLEEDVTADIDDGEMELAEALVRRPGQTFRSDVIAGDDRSPEEIAARRQLGVALVRILDELDPTEREALATLARDGSEHASVGSPPSNHAVLEAAEGARVKVFAALRRRGLLD